MNASLNGLLIGVLLLGAGFSFSAQGVGADPLAAVRADLNSAQADDAIRRIDQLLATNPDDAEAYNLLCRVYYMEERWDEAIQECERAVRLAPGSSNYHMWLGRAYGEKADRVSFITAYMLGKKVKSEFETAVKLDPRNVDALSNLAEFYTDAPAIAGGGADKAERVASELDQIDPVSAHDVRGRLAESQKDYAKAEAEFQAAIAASPHPASEWVVLASFYRHRERWDDMMGAINTALNLDKDHTVAQVNASSVLTRANREPQLAILALQNYLSSSHKREDEPAIRVHVDLAKLLAKQGDTAGEQREYAAAAAMAKDYKAAKKPPTNTGR